MINKEDQHKIIFTTPRGIFYFVVMNFGLKNVGATYQRVMVTMFHDLIHKPVEFYMDDILA